MTADPDYEDDVSLFRRTVGPVRPVESRRLPLRPPPPKPRPRFSRQDEVQVLEDMLSDYFHPAELETGEELLFLRDGVRPRLLRDLRRGHYSIGAECDLHGLIVPEARALLVEFLHQARAEGLRCVRIIHGKGLGSWQRLPVLKTKVNHWLRQRDEVLAFCQARHSDGGSGAIYVLLRR